MNAHPRRVFTLAIFSVSLFVSICLGQAQTTTTISQSGLTGPPDTLGPNHRGWTVPDSQGTAKHFVELATGMNYWNPLARAWQPSAAFFQPTRDGSAFVANQVQHKVRLNDDLYISGAVNVTLPDGLTISSSPVAIVLFDAASGQSAIVATLTNSLGTQVSSNQVVYPDAFVGACADVSYSIDRGAFSQDIVFTGRFDPAAYGFPTNTTRIQILTELFSVPQPDLLVQPVYIEGNAAVRKAMASPDLMDESIGFGNFVLGAGKAYAFPSADEPDGAGAAVAKEFVRTQDGRTFLVETVDYKYLAKALLALPECNPPKGTARHYPRNERRKLYAAVPAFSNTRRASLERPIQAKATAPKVASVRPAKGVIIDYIANIGGSLTGNILFAANTNYFVNGAVFCNGPTTIEAAVFKYPTNGTPYIQLNNTVTWKTSAYRPAVFTAVDDDTIGDSFASVSGANYHGFITPSGYANPAIYMGQTTLTLNNCRFCYAKQAVLYVSASGSTAATLTVNHSQFVNCIRGIELDYAGSGTGTGALAVNLNNSLMSAVQNPIMGGSPGNPVTFSMIHCTVDQGIRLVGGSWNNGSPSVSSINSIYANLTNTTTAASLSGNHNGFYSDAQSFGTSKLVVSSNPFQQVGAGFYYLTDASGFRNAGTATGVGASLITALGKRTTYPPLITAQTTLNSPQTYSAQAQRDTDTLDLGFHYDPLDWELGAVLVTNALITVNPGAAIAGFGTNAVSYGLAIGQGASLQCQGTPTTPNWIVQFNSVQEQPYTSWFRDTNGVISSEFQGLSPGSTINFRFTDFAMPSLDAPVFNGPTNSGPFNFQDCEVHGGKLVTVRPTVNLTNCLLERAFTDLEPKDGLTAAFRVGLVYGGTFTFAPSNSVVEDVLFDSPTISNWNGYNGGYNAYITGLSRLSPTKTSDIILSASPSYQVGPLGNYYLPTNSTTLIDADTTTAASQIGLYHYATTTNLDSGTGLEVKETTSNVDVSYHYVATDGNGIPIDTNSDGIPDYLEDANGNGNVDSGEISWSATGDLGLRVWITEPKRNANLP